MVQLEERRGRPAAARQAGGPAELAVDRDAELPVGTQLAWRLRGLIATGRLRADEKLPSVRELAKRASVNVNTARAVYARLEREGLIVSRQGAGTFVREGAEPGAEVERLAERALAAAAEAGVEPRELASAIYATATAPSAERSSPTPLPGQVRERDRLTARRELRRQIARLEAELAGYADEATARRPDRSPRRPGDVAHVAGIAELERTRDWLVGRLRAVQADSERRGRRHARARARVEAMVREPERHKWSWVSSEETGDLGCKEWRVVPRFGPVGAAMGWWQVKVSGGCPLAAPLAAAWSH